MTENCKSLLPRLNFTKMEGAGNDYIYVDATEILPDYDISAMAREVSDRHFGVGADGLVLIMKSEVADFRMRMFNADGSEAQMCGNASRCIGKFVYDRHLTEKKVVTLETLAGIKVLHLHIDDATNTVSGVTVDMGVAVIEENVTLTAEGKSYDFTKVNVGNPHAVTFIDEITDEDVLRRGPILEIDKVFPEKANIEFAKVIDDATIEMRVWERGTGETLACGTGACATAAAAIHRNLNNGDVDIKLIGGTLHIHLDKDNGHLFMTGPARFVADGVFYPIAIR